MVATIPGPQPPGTIYQAVCKEGHPIWTGTKSGALEKAYKEAEQHEKDVHAGESVAGVIALPPNGGIGFGTD